MPGVDALVERAPATETLAIRQRVLRPHQTIADLAAEGDDDPATVYFVARDATSGEVVSTASVRHEAPPWDPGARNRLDHVGPADPLDAPEVARLAAGEASVRAWRLRGMATDENLRGRGLGRLVLDAVVDHVRDGGGGLLWCSARIGAVPFYERAGFTGLGGVFEEPHIGSHLLMWRPVEGGRP